MSGTIQSRAKRPPALLLPLLAGPGSGLPLRSPPILRCTASRPAASSGGAAATAKEANFGQRRARTHAHGAGCSSPHQASHFFPLGKLMRILFSRSSSTQNNPRHSQRRRIQAVQSLRKEVEEGKSPALKQSLVSAFPGLVLINNTPQLQGLRECQAFPHPQ